jgi:hypothetical protein
MKLNRHLFPHKLLEQFGIPALLLTTLLCVQACSPPEFSRFQDASYTMSAKCPDLILYPVNAVDQSDQYRFDYSDVGFGNTHSQGATVAITCSTGSNSQAVVDGHDQISV